MRFLLFVLFVCLLSARLSGQEDSLRIKTEKVPLDENFNQMEYDPLAPATAAFYSAVLPGLGQAYNGKYWKIPLVYAGLGIGMYFVIDNDQQYDRYRDAYKRRLAGYSDDEFQGLLSEEALIEAQKHYQRQKEISIFVTIAIYVINIIDANVDAHLKQFNVSKDLSISPNLQANPHTGNQEYGFSLNLGF